MEKVSIATRDLRNEFAVDGLSLVSQVKNISKFYNIPNALLGVDEKFHTHTFQDVLEAATDSLEVLVDDNKVQVLDPKSTYLDNEAFYALVEVGDLNPTITNQGFQARAVYELTDESEYLGDVFKKQMIVTRRAEGGLAISTQIVRQICTNGCIVPDKQYAVMLRDATKCDAATLVGAFGGVQDFDVAVYLESLFSKNGVPVQASMSDVYEMQATLIEMTNDDLGHLLYNTERMEQFYINQGVDVTKLARKYLDKLPSGLTMYQATNILTNGAKCMAEDTLENHIKVANFYNPSKMRCLQNIQEFHFEGVPTFTPAEVKLFMGDGFKTAEAVINSLR